MQNQPNEAVRAELKKLVADGVVLSISTELIADVPSKTDAVVPAAESTDAP